jgi:hypothetical protein
MREWALFLILFSQMGWSGTLPSWVLQGKKTDGRYKYYVGYSESSNEEEAFSDASRQAFEKAIRENFGFMTKIHSETYETSEEAKTLKRIQEKTQNIHVDGFEQSDFYVERKDPDSLKTWVLFRYSLQLIEREKKRLSSQPFDDENIELYPTSDLRNVYFETKKEKNKVPSIDLKELYPLILSFEFTVPSYKVGGNVGFRISHTVGLELGYGIEFPQRESTVHRLHFGVPFFFSRNAFMFYATPEIFSLLSYTYPFTHSGWGYGLSCGARYFFSLASLDKSNGIGIKLSIEKSSGNFVITGAAEWIFLY